MIKKFHLFEKQLQLFDLPKTDKDVIHQVITKHQTKPVPVNIKRGNKLQDDLDKWTSEEIINKKIYDYLKNSDFGGDYMDLLSKNLEVLCDYVEEKPEMISNSYKNLPEWPKNERGKEKTLSEIIRSDDYWFCHVDNYVEDEDDFKNYFLESTKNNLYQLYDVEYLYDLKDAIYDSKDPYRLKIYRAITLPKNVEELDDYNGVGVYWTYDKEKAEAYWSKHNREFILEGWVYSNGIDWEETVYKSIYIMKDEREIFLYNETPIELTSVYMKSIYNEFREINSVIDEEKRIIKLFGLKSDQISNYLINKHKNMSTIIFDEPIWVKA